MITRPPLVVQRSGEAVVESYGKGAKAIAFCHPAGWVQHAGVYNRLLITPVGAALISCPVASRTVFVTT